MNQSVSALGDAVRAIRKSKNLSQEALAEKIGVCKRTIIDIEKNTGNPKFEILCMLVRELDIPLYQVFYPEMEENIEIKNILMQELNGCSEYEMKIILSVVKSLRDTLKCEEAVVHSNIAESINKSEWVSSANKVKILIYYILVVFKDVHN